MFIWSNKTNAVPPANPEGVNIPVIYGKGRDSYTQRSNQEQKLFDKEQRRKKYLLPKTILYPYDRFIKKEFIAFCKTHKYYDRLQVLKWFTGKNRKSKLSYETRRAHINRITKDATCILCDGMADAWHHVILVSKGGGNEDNNLVPVCKECHKKIHPWMK